jgi:predicted membrane protein
METNKTNKIFLSVLSVAFLAGGAALCAATMNGICGGTSAFAGLTLVLLSIFLYVGGATIAGKIFAKGDGYRFGGVNDGLVFALLVIAAGALLLGFNTGALNPLWKSYFVSWWMLLLVVGAMNVCRGHIVGGLVCAGIAKFFLMERVTEIYPNDPLFANFEQTYWPAMIIFFGVICLFYIVLRPLRHKICNRQKNNRWNSEYVADATENSDGKIDYRFVFSGADQALLDPVFRGGNIEVICGGMQLDLRSTTLEEGDTCLYIKAIAGGVKMTVPVEWFVEIRQSGYLGGAVDSRPKMNDYNRSRRLIVFADCKMGGVEIGEN